MCQEIVDVPVQALGSAAVALKAGTQAAWAERAPGIGVPAAAQGQCAKLTHLDARVVGQEEKEKVRSSFVPWAAIPVPPTPG